MNSLYTYLRLEIGEVLEGGEFYELHQHTDQFISIISYEKLVLNGNLKKIILE